MEGYSKEEYNKMLIEILDRSIELGNQSIVMSLFIFVESMLLLLKILITFSNVTISDGLYNVHRTFNAQFTHYA